MGIPFEVEIRRFPESKCCYIIGSGQGNGYLHWDDGKWHDRAGTSGTWENEEQARRFLRRMVKVSDMPLPRNVIRLLLEVEVTTLGELASQYRHLLLFSDGFGPGTVAQIEEALQCYGRLSLRSRFLESIEEGRPNPVRLSTPILEIGFSERTKNCLKRSGLVVCGMLMFCSDEELLTIPQFGVRCLAEVREVLLAAQKHCWREVHENL